MSEVYEIAVVGQYLGRGVSEFFTVFFECFYAAGCQRRSVPLPLVFREKRESRRAYRYRLSGSQALAHARNRSSAGSDFDRTSRQRDVLMAVMGEFKSANLNDIRLIVSDIGGYITTNLTQNEILTLVWNSLTYLNYPLETYFVPQYSEYGSLIPCVLWLANSIPRTRGSNRGTCAI